MQSKVKVQTGQILHSAPVLRSNMDRIQYATCQLIALNKPKKKHSLSPASFTKLKALGLIKKTAVTSRGCRVGKQHRKAIRKVNLINLIYVQPSFHLFTRFQKKLKFCVVNTRSIRNNCDSFVDYVISNEIDLCIVTETWLKQYDDAVRTACQPEGCTFLDQPKPSGRMGGGTALQSVSLLKVKKLDAAETGSFEYSEWWVTEGSFKLRLSIIYRPPYSVNHPVPVSVFQLEFSKYLQQLILCTEPLLITGDFNIHADI